MKEKNPIGIAIIAAIFIFSALYGAYIAVIGSIIRLSRLIGIIANLLLGIGLLQRKSWFYKVFYPYSFLVITLLLLATISVIFYPPVRKEVSPIVLLICFPLYMVIFFYLTRAKIKELFK